MVDNLKEMIKKARVAQKIIEFWPQEKVDEMVAAAAWEAFKQENAEACARMATDETKMGIYEHKLIKHQKKTIGTLRDLDGVKTVGIIEEDKEKGLIKIAKPVGVVAALIPVTNPTSTPPGNGLPILKTRNAVIFAPHPTSKGCTNLVVDYMRKGLEKVGAPVNLLQCIKEPSVELAQELMGEVDLIVATGGAGMVKAAYSAGKPAYGVGAGNAVMVVDETADLKDAAHKIFLGKTFDNATSCSSENSAVMQASIFDTMLNNLKNEGGYLCNADEKARLKTIMWPDGTHLNREIVAQSPLKIAKMAKISVPNGTKFIMVLGGKIGKEDMFGCEKLSPVLTLWKFDDFPEAIDYVEKITKFCGFGHSCGIHTTSSANIIELATQVKVSRIMVRQPQCYGNSGNYDNGMPFSMTLGCGTWGGNITSENIAWKHFLNVTWVSQPIEPVIPNEEKLFSRHWKKFGK